MNRICMGVAGLMVLSLSAQDKVKIELPVAAWHKTSPGLNPKGGKADAPMPTYKMKASDVDAIMTYLKSLKE